MTLGTMSRGKDDRRHLARLLAARDDLRMATWQNYLNFQDKMCLIQDKIWSLLQEYEVLCQEASARRSEIIAKAVAQHPALGAAVQSDPSILPRIPSANTAIWISPPEFGIRLSFEPLEGFSWDASSSPTTNKAITSGTLLPDVPQLPPPPAMSTPTEHKATIHVDQANPNGDKGCQVLARSERRKFREIPSVPEAPDHGRTVTNAESRRLPSHTQSKPEDPIPSNANEWAPVRRSQRQAPRQPFPNTIRRRAVKATKAWIFEYDAAGYPGAMYILRCPSPSCQSRVFTCHPMKNKRAAKHLSHCNISFKDEKDIVMRFAEQIVIKASDKKPCLDQRWARNWNATLIPANHPELAEDNFKICDET